MQCRVNDVIVNDVPKFLTLNPTDNTHAIVVQDPDDLDQHICFPLDLQGVTSYLTVRKPTLIEWESGDILHIDMTAEHLDWDPNNPTYSQQEAAMTDFRGKTISRPDRGQTFVINSLSSMTSSAIDVTDNENFGLALDLQVTISIAALDTTKTKPGRIHSKAGKPVDAETLAKRWMIPAKRANATVTKTTQRGVRTCLHPTLSRRFPTNDRMLRYSRMPHRCFSDTMFAGTESKSGNKCAQVFATSFGWARAYPMKRKGDAHEALSLLFKQDGVPHEMILDDSKEQTQGNFKRKLNEANCHMKMTEPYSPWQQAAEGCIRELKRGVSRKMLKTGSPKRLWDHCIELEGLIRSHTANDIFSTGGEVPETIMKGGTADISQICEFGWYDWVMFRDTIAAFPDDKLVLGRYLGPATDVGSAMTAKILKQNGQFVCRSTLRHISIEELACPVHAAARTHFDNMIVERIGPNSTPGDFDAEDLTPEMHHFIDHTIEEGELEGNAYDEGSPDEDDLEPLPTPEAGDNYLSADITLPVGGVLTRGRVISRKRDADGNTVGRANGNPILDTRTYNVEFDDGTITELTANKIAECMYAQCDPTGNQYVLLDCFVDFDKLPTAMSLADQTIVVKGRASKRRNTFGWRICCQWKDGSTTWESLKDLKESHPLEMAEYAVAQDIQHEPAFNWWVPQVLRLRARIISLVKRRKMSYLKKNMKFGIEVPTSVDHALDIDKKNGNTLWADAIAKEMKDVRIAFQCLHDGDRAPIGYKWIKCHMIFDIKIEDFRRKARMVAGGHMTGAPTTMTYASVVSRETVRIALTIAALNDLEVKAADILNAYISAPIKEKVWCVLGPEFGPDTGKSAIIVRALYGLKSAGAAFHAHLADCMRHLGYKSCPADPDLWLKEMTRPDTKELYYSYILIYVDDILCIHHDAMTVLDKLDKYFTLKPASVGDPSMYLGAKLKITQLNNGVWAWGMSPSKYIKEAVSNCEKHLQHNYDGRYTLPTQAANPFLMGYEPEIDETPALDPERATYYQSIIGIMRWMCEIGRIDIATEVSLLSSHLAYPREGHLDAALHIMGYLKLKNNSRLIFDPSYPVIDEDSFQHHEWEEFYGDVTEAIPTNAPPPLGKDVDLRMMVDSDHAGDKSTRRSRTGFLIFLNMSLIAWLSQKQPTIESSVFGAEFVAMKNGVEALRGIRYKLRMMGVPLTGASYVYGDNMSVIHNTQRPESTLRKKNLSICYHVVREAVAMGEILTTHIRTDNNLSDFMTKVTFGQKRRHLVGSVLYDLYDDYPSKKRKLAAD
jgi:hypothetical protein